MFGFVPIFESLFDRKPDSSFLVLAVSLSGDHMAGTSRNVAGDSTRSGVEHEGNVFLARPPVDVDVVVLVFQPAIVIEKPDSHFHQVLLCKPGYGPIGPSVVTAEVLRLELLSIDPDVRIEVRIVVFERHVRIEVVKLFYAVND